MKPLAILVLILLSALSACDSDSGPQKALGAYGAHLVQVHPQDLLKVGAPEQTVGNPRGYLTIFTASNPDMLTRPGGATDPAIYRYNEHITKRWQETYCGSEMQVILRQQDIQVASAQLVDGTGAKHSLAICVRQR